MPVRFNFLKFASAWLESQAKRGLAKEFDDIGRDNLLWVIDRNRCILDYYPPGRVAKLKQYAEVFRDADVMTWLSPATLAVLRSHPNGETWMKEQIRLLKERLGV